MEKIETILKSKTTNLFADRTEDLSSFFKWFSNAYRINFSKVNFVYDGQSSFIPLSGDYNVLGKIIEIKQYEWQEFTELIRDTKTTLYFTGKIEKDHQINKYFNVIYSSGIDYPLTITYLETLGLVKTKVSESFIATDPRVFSIVNLDNQDTPCLWYEVDILGTSYGNKITADVLDLFNKYKVVNMDIL